MKNSHLAPGRRDFIKVAGLASLSFMLPASGQQAFAPSVKGGKQGMFGRVNFTSDGLNYTPEEYLEKMLEINRQAAIEPDYYGRGGATAKLEAAFVRITGKEKAVFLPTGTLANELSIKLLAGDKAKIIVPENSHIFRDEADAAQIVHSKRLVPAGKGMSYFDAEELGRTIDYLRQGEVFRSEVGAVAIENPVRRADGTAVPLATIKTISDYCRTNGYGLHLDGARLHLASAWTGIPIREYASYSDTVYISLYKYLNAPFGAILCGDAGFIEHLPHQAKIHGAAVFQTWNSSAIALHHLETIEDDLQQAKAAGEKLIPLINALGPFKITSIPDGTNIFNLKTRPDFNLDKFQKVLSDDHNILLGTPYAEGNIKFKVNASIVRRPTEEIAEAWKEAVRVAGS